MTFDLIFYAPNIKSNFYSTWAWHNSSHRMFTLISIHLTNCQYKLFRDFLIQIRFPDKNNLFACLKRKGLGLAKSVPYHSVPYGVWCNFIKVSLYVWCQNIIVSWCVLGCYNILMTLFIWCPSLNGVTIISILDFLYVWCHHIIVSLFVWPWENHFWPRNCILDSLL